MSTWLNLLALLLATSPLMAQELVIERPEPIRVVKVDGLPAGWEKLDGELYRASFLVSEDFLKRSPGSHLVRVILEKVGVPFGPGASASFDPEHSTITVTNTRAALEMVSVVVEADATERSSLVTVRTEIYQVTSLQALQLSESCASETDHRPERDAVLDAVRKGKAKLVATHSLATTFGQRAITKDTYELSYAFTHNEAGEPIDFDSREIGTIVEFEPQRWTFDIIAINLDLEHHTADPEFIEMPGKVVAPRFHNKAIRGTFHVLDGDYKLIGTWKPTGKAEYAEKDVRHVIFITASIQRG